MINQYTSGAIQGQQAQLGVGGRQMSLAESVQQQLAYAQAEVQRLTELAALLEGHPEVNRILELMGQRGNY